MYTPNEHELKLMKARRDETSPWVSIIDVDLLRLEEHGFIKITGSRTEDFDLTAKGLKILEEN